MLCSLCKIDGVLYFFAKDKYIKFNNINKKKYRYDNVYNIWIVYCSFFIAILLHVILFSINLHIYQPSWVMILFVYWVIELPKQVNVGTGFVIGLITDCMLGSILGTHALSFSILSYLIIRKIYFFRNMSVYRQIFFITFFSFINQLIKFLIKFLFTKDLYISEFFLYAILDGGIWPFLLILMRRIL